MELRNKYDEIRKNISSEYSDLNSIPFNKINNSSKNKVYWYCKVCRENYLQQVRHRIYELSGCPRCKRKKNKTPLSIRYPKLVEIYNNHKNLKNLNYYSSGSREKLWWKCKVCENEMYSRVKDRIKYNCKNCTSVRVQKERNKKIIEKKGSLKTLYPHIASEWDYSKNKLGPEDYLAGSGKKVWWICSYGHSWFVDINSRTKKNTSCRKCGNQNSKYEIRLFSELSLFDKGILWNEKINGKECDLFLPNLNISIEIDGYPWHDSVKSRTRDLKKSKELEKNDIKTLRFRDIKLKKLTNDEVTFEHEKDYFQSFISLLHLIIKYSKSDSVNQKILKYVNENKTFVNQKKYEKLYFTSGKRIFRKSLQEEFPEIAKEWSVKNHPLTPNDVYSRGKKIVWWDCKKCNIPYQKMVKARTRKDKGEGCPCGSTKVVTSKNNLVAVIGTHIKDHWDYKLNKLPPEKFRFGSRKEVWWRCPEGHSYLKTIGTWSDTRNKNVRCNTCKRTINKLNFKNKPTENTNLMTRIGFHIKDHWDYKLNEKNPEDYFPSSNEKVWWKCPNGHSYLRKISIWTDLRFKKVKCPECNIFIEKINDDSL